MLPDLSAPNTIILAFLITATSLLLQACRTRAHTGLPKVGPRSRIASQTSMWQQEEDQIKPSTVFSQLWLLLALAISLAALLGARALDSNAGMPTNRLFDSQLVPTSTVAAPRSSPTPAPIAYPTATPGGSRSPAGATRKIYLPLSLQWYPKIVYGWKGVGPPAEDAQLGANSSNGFWGIYPNWWYNWGYSGPFMRSQVHSAAETLAGLEARYINAVAWFSTHYPSFTASNLLNYYSGHAGERTPVGDTWRDTACANCQCPGPDCQ